MVKIRNIKSSETFRKQDGYEVSKRHDEVIKSIAFDVTMQLIENRILQSKDSNIKLVEASNVAQHNTVWLHL